VRDSKKITGKEYSDIPVAPVEKPPTAPIDVPGAPGYQEAAPLTAAEEAEIATRIASAKPRIMEPDLPGLSSQQKHEHLLDLAGKAKNKLQQKKLDEIAYLEETLARQEELLSRTAGRPISDPSIAQTKETLNALKQEDLVSQKTLDAIDKVVADHAAGQIGTTDAYQKISKILGIRRPRPSRKGPLQTRRHPRGGPIAPPQTTEGAQPVTFAPTKPKPGPESPLELRAEPTPTPPPEPAVVTQTELPFVPAKPTTIPELENLALAKRKEMVARLNVGDEAGAAAIEQEIIEIGNEIKLMRAEAPPLPTTPAGAPTRRHAFPEPEPPIPATTEGARPATFTPGRTEAPPKPPAPPPITPEVPPTPPAKPGMTSAEFPFFKFLKDKKVTTKQYDALSQAEKDVLWNEWAVQVGQPPRTTLAESIQPPTPPPTPKTKPPIAEAMEPKPEPPITLKPETPPRRSLAEIEEERAAMQELSRGGGAQGELFPPETLTIDQATDRMLAEDLARRRGISVPEAQQLMDDVRASQKSMAGEVTLGEVETQHELTQHIGGIRQSVADRIEREVAVAREAAAGAEQELAAAKKGTKVPLGAMPGGGTAAVVEGGEKPPPKPPKPPTEPPTIEPSGGVLEPRVRLPYTQEVRDQAIKNIEQIVEAAASEPEKRLYMVLRDLIKNGELEIGPELLARHNMSIHEFAEWFRDTYHKWGKQGKQLSDIAKLMNKLAKENPEINRALDVLKRFEREATAFEKFNKASKSWADLWRASIISLPHTAVRNAISQLGIGTIVKTPDILFEHLFQAMFPHLRGTIKSSVSDDMASLANAIWSSKNFSTKEARRILKHLDDIDALGNIHNKHLLELLGEVGAQAMLPRKYMNVITAMNSTQEKFFRNISFRGSVRLEMERAGIKNAQQIIDLTPEAIPVDLIEKALRTARVETLSASPPAGSFAKQLTSAFEQMPFLYYIFPFPRMWYNGMKFMTDHSPIGMVRAFTGKHGDRLFGLKSPAAQRALIARHGTTEAAIEQLSKEEQIRLMATGATGTAMLLAAYAIRKSEWAGPKWSEFMIDEEGQGAKEVLDGQAYGPGIGYFAIAELVKSAEEASDAAWADKSGNTFVEEFQKKHNMTQDDWLAFVLSMNRLGGTLKVVPELLRTGSDKPQAIYNFLAEIAGGYATPAEYFRLLPKLLGSEESLTLRQTRADISAKVGQHIPGFSEALEPRYDPLTGEAARIERPLSVVSGLITRTQPELQREMGRLGMDIWRFLPRAGDAQIENVLGRYMGEFLREKGDLLLQSRRYQEADKYAKQYMLSSVVLSPAKQYAEARLAQTNPEMYRKMLKYHQDHGLVRAFLGRDLREDE